MATTSADRLVALDTLRGATIAAMIVVNTPGTWSSIYPPLRHADWHGLTPTDLVFPFFLFIVGISVTLALAKQRQAGVAPQELHRRILWRALKIFTVGLFLNLWPDFAWADLRVAGVLQRIALVYAVVAFLYLHLRWRGLVSVTLVLLLGYWALLASVPVPRDAVIDEALSTGEVERAHGAHVPVIIEPRSETHVRPNLEPGTNLAAWVDRTFLPGRQYERTWDPEGWLSTVPSIATGLLGVLTGLLLRHVRERRRQLGGLAGAALLLLAIGYAWSLAFPLNKNLWTSSYVLVSGGWTLVGLALMMWLVDGLQWRRPVLPFLAFGANPITAYVLAGMLTVVFLRPWFGGLSIAQAFMNSAQSIGASRPLASFLFAIFYTSVIFVPIYELYRRRIFIRL